MILQDLSKNNWKVKEMAYISSQGKLKRDSKTHNDFAKKNKTEKNPVSFF